VPAAALSARLQPAPSARDMDAPPAGGIELALAMAFSSANNDVRDRFAEPRRGNRSRGPAARPIGHPKDNEEASRR